MSIPDFFALNDRPVKVVKHASGGYEAMALDMENGDWVEAPEYLDRFWRRDGELEMLSENEFKERVSSIRRRLGRAP